MLKNTLFGLQWAVRNIVMFFFFFQLIFIAFMLLGTMQTKTFWEVLIPIFILLFPILYSFLIKDTLSQTSVASLGIYLFAAVPLFIAFILIQLYLRKKTNFYHTNPTYGKFIRFTVEIFGFMSILFSLGYYFLKI